MTTEQHHLNPIGRLWLFTAHMGSATSSAQLVDVVGSYLNVDVNDVPKLMEGISALAALPGQARTALDGLQGSTMPRDTIDPAIDAVGWAFAQTHLVEGRAVDFQNHVTEGSRVALQMWSQLLNSLHGLRPSTDGLDGIRQILDQLRQQLTEDDSIPEPVRRALYDHVERMLRSIDFFHISGIDATLAELDRLYGHIERDPEVRVVIDHNKPLRERMKQLVGAVALAANLVNATVAIESGIGKLVGLEATPTAVVAPAAGDVVDERS
ncbi:hypothetical protein [Leifsonia shinshuensis]